MVRRGRKRMRAAFIAVFSLLAAGIGISGLAYYLQQQAHLRAAKFDELAAIADLKVQELMTWRQVQVANALAPLRNPFTGRAVRQWLSGGADTGLRTDLEEWMRGILENYDYRSVLLLDAEGRVGLAVPEGVAVDPGMLDQLRRAPPRGGPVFADIHRGGPEKDVVLPLFTPMPHPENAQKPPIGFFVLNIDPSRYLFPFVQNWPTPSPSAETLLVRRDGDEVVYLNDLRHRGETALTLRYPLLKADLPASRAVQEGSGAMEGIDYRGVPVLAVFRPVPGTPWALVAKVDQQETYAPLRQSAILVGLLVTALIAAAGEILLLVLGRETARFHREQKLALEERDRARTEVLQTERRAAAGLKEAKEVAEKANRAKSEFLAHMSHELRTPLTVIMGYHEVLLQADPSPRQRQFLETAEIAARRLLGIIDDLLDISRIEDRRLRIEERPFALRDCVRQAVEMFTVQAREKGVRLRWEVAPQVPAQVQGDPDRLGQLLVNLVGNAVKFTHRGEVAVTVTAREDGIEFTVRDTGIGIPADRLKDIFSPFTQADSSLTRRYGGTGLGLTICRELVELMGGRIEAQSAEGEGSTFSFRLPLRAVEFSGSPPAPDPRPR